MYYHKSNQTFLVVDEFMNLTILKKTKPLNYRQLIEQHLMNKKDILKTTWKYWKEGD
jgi:hypothetical protein